MAKVISTTNRNPAGEKEIKEGFNVSFGPDPLRPTANYHFKLIDGQFTCDVADREHLTLLAAAGYQIVPGDDKEQKAVERAQAEGEALAKKREQEAAAHQEMLNREAKKRLDRAKKDRGLKGTDNVAVVG